MVSELGQLGEPGAFGRNVAKYRSAAGLTENKLARIVNIPVETLRSIERGEMYPSLSTIGKLERELSLEPGSLLEDDPLGQVMRRLFEKYDVSKILWRLRKIADEKKPKIEGFFDLGSVTSGKN